MTSGEPDGDELLSPPRPLLPRRVRLAVIVLLALAVAAGVAVAAWPDQHHASPVVAATSRTTPRPAPVPTFSQSAAPRRWPTARAACGGRSDLPFVTGALPVGGRHTGITAMVGGEQVARLDFDSGHLQWANDLRLTRDEYVTGIVAGEPIRIVTHNCFGPDIEGPRVFDLTEHGAVAVPVPGRIDDILVDGQQMWALRLPTGPTNSGTLIPLGGGAPVRLPPGFLPGAISDGVVVGGIATPSDAGRLVLVDATTGLIRRSLGNADVLVAAGGVVVWTTGCEIVFPTACRAHRQAIAGGPVTSYRLPRPPAFSLTALSPDGRLLAFSMERAGPDPRFEVEHPFPPADIAVLHLDSGVVDTVPGIELPAKSSPALGFTDGGWLVIALDSGIRTRVLAWRPGLAHPVESRAVPGLVSTPPALLITPRRDATDSRVGRWGMQRLR